MLTIALSYHVKSERIIKVFVIADGSAIVLLVIVDGSPIVLLVIVDGSPIVLLVIVDGSPIVLLVIKYFYGARFFFLANIPYMVDCF